MYREGFGSKLKKARENTGFTQLEVSKDTKISRVTLSQYENGQRQPDLENLGILADYYGVSVDWLLSTAGGDIEKVDRYDQRHGKNTDDKKVI